MFHAIANIIQLALISNGPLFHVDYGEDEFHAVQILGKSRVTESNRQYDIALANGST